MSINHSPSIVTDGLVLHYDMDNGKSFVGAPITNVLDNPSVNAYPTYGNGWGTYNTNQYNGNSYFSIGTIASVSGNIITTTSAHPLFSYSVVTPQTSGGGVTAGTNYLVKKLSSTTFSLHAWNSSQDGSQGYINPATGNHKVFDDFANDVRVSVNASGFPTMWWGPPHLPNSCLVKELLPSGFTGMRGRMPTDCMRLHWIQPDGITDGMAYGANASVTANQVHTVSFWLRAVTPSAVGQSLSYSIYNYGQISPAGYGFSAVLTQLGVWQKYTYTFTPVNPYCISYWFPSSGNMKVDLANIQFESGSIANNFVAGSRSASSAILDMTGNNTITANSLTYASDGTFSFNGSNNYITAALSNYLNMPPEFTLEAWVKPLSATSDRAIIILGMGSYYLTIDGAYKLSVYCYGKSPSGYHTTNDPVTSGSWNHICASWTSNEVSLYINGQFKNSMSTSGFPNTPNTQIIMGAEGNGSTRQLNGYIGATKIYNRALTASEVKQNFNALRGRYGL